jgi:hypothetical protein
MNSQPTHVPLRPPLKSISRRAAWNPNFQRRQRPSFGHPCPGEIIGDWKVILNAVAPAFEVYFPSRIGSSACHIKHGKTRTGTGVTENADIRRILDENCGRQAPTQRICSTLAPANCFGNPEIFETTRAAVNRDRKIVAFSRETRAIARPASPAHPVCPSRNVALMTN